MICLVRMKNGALCMLALSRGGQQNKNWLSTSRLIPPRTCPDLKNLMKEALSFCKTRKILQESGEIERLTLKDGFAFILFKTEVIQ